MTETPIDGHRKIANPQETTIVVETNAVDLYGPEGKLWRFPPGTPLDAVSSALDWANQAYRDGIRKGREMQRFETIRKESRNRTKPGKSSL